MIYFAHAGEDHTKAAVETPNLLDALTHQPVWLSLIIVAFVLFGLYVLLEKLRVKAFNRILALIPMLILIAIVYVQHNPLVTTVLLTIGFAASFFIAFTQLTKHGGKSDDKGSDNQ